MAQIHYKKKVIVTEEAASAEARSARLRKVRNLANLTRKELCNSDDLNLATYKSWELARFGGLPLDGASKIVARVKQENVICTTDWLLYEKGNEPFVLSQKAHNPQSDEPNFASHEIALFMSLYPEATYARIVDDALAPHYNPGDYVAGTKLFGNAISTAVNQPCIVELPDGNILVRYLKQGKDKTHYQLLATNIHCTIQPNHIESSILSATPITRHYVGRLLANGI